MAKSLPLKIAVVCFSLTLGCGYVGYRQKHDAVSPGAIRSGDGARPTHAVLSGSKNPNRVFSTPNPAPTVLPSSKSIDHVLMNPNRSGSPRTNSDFISDTLPPLPPADDKKAPPEAPKTRTVLPGSKIGPIFLPTDTEQKAGTPEQIKR